MVRPEWQRRRTRCTAVERRGPSLIVTPEVATGWIDSMVTGEVPYSAALAQVLQRIATERD